MYMHLTRAVILVLESILIIESCDTSHITTCSTGTLQIEREKKVSGWDLNLGTHSRQENVTNGFYSVLRLIKAYAIT